MQNSDLPKCPFCGGEAELYSMKQDKRKIHGVHYKIATIRCTAWDCNANVSQAGVDEEKAFENAAKLWNRRATDEKAD